MSTNSSCATSLLRIWYACLILTACYILTIPQQVGHTGVYDAAVEAISHTDKAVGTVYKACEEAGYILLITADHGNAEQMLNPDTGAPHTAHTTNAVPFIMTGDSKKLSFAEDKKDGEEDEGALCDVAPTVLDILVSVDCVEIRHEVYELWWLFRAFSSLRVSYDDYMKQGIVLTSVYRDVRAIFAGEERVDIDIE